MKELQFRVRFRQFEAGDPVPAAWDDGVRGTLLHVGKAEWVEVPEGESVEKVCVPEADKMVRPNARIKRKVAGE